MSFELAFFSFEFFFLRLVVLGEFRVGFFELRVVFFDLSVRVHMLLRKESQ